jgi:putative cell wall-binding protein
VKRLEGTNRYKTAAAIATEAELRSLRNNVRFLRTQQVVGKEAFVFNGAKWTDGLAAGPVAAFGEAPVLMVGATALPPATAAWIEDNGIEAVHIVGGEDSVSSGVVAALQSLSTTPTVDRIEGGDRYGTARAVAQFGVDHYGMYAGSVTLVSAASPWDALSAGQLSFMTYSPLLLTSPTALSPQVTKFYDDNGGFHSPSYVVGGEGSVGAAPYTGLRDLWKRPVLR